MAGVRAKLLSSPCLGTIYPVITLYAVFSTFQNTEFGISSRGAWRHVIKTLSLTMVSLSTVNKRTKGLSRRVGNTQLYDLSSYQGLKGQRRFPPCSVKQIPYHQTCPNGQVKSTTILNDCLDIHFVRGWVQGIGNLPFSPFRILCDLIFHPFSSSLVNDYTITCPVLKDWLSLQQPNLIWLANHTPHMQAPSEANQAHGPRLAKL